MFYIHHRSLTSRHFWEILRIFTIIDICTYLKKDIKEILIKYMNNHGSKFISECFDLLLCVTLSRNCQQTKAVEQLQKKSKFNFKVLLTSNILPRCTTSVPTHLLLLFIRLLKTLWQRIFDPENVLTDSIFRYLFGNSAGLHSLLPPTRSFPPTMWTTWQDLW